MSTVVICHPIPNATCRSCGDPTPADEQPCWQCLIREQEAHKQDVLDNPDAWASWDELEERYIV